MVVSARSNIGLRRVLANPAKLMIMPKPRNWAIPEPKLIVAGGILEQQLFGFVVWKARCIRAGALMSQKSLLIDFIELHELAPVQ